MKIKENGKIRIQCDISPESYQKLKRLSYYDSMGTVLDRAIKQYHPDDLGDAILELVSK